MPSPLHGGPLSDLEGILKARATSQSAAEQRQALRVIGQVAPLRQGNAQDQNLRWYYLQFGLVWDFTTERQGERVTYGRRKTLRHCCLRNPAGRFNFSSNALPPSSTSAVMQNLHPSLALSW